MEHCTSHATNLFLPLLLTLLIPRFTVAYRDPLNEAMYQYHAYTPCRTFFNATGPVGCHSTKGGIVAPLFSVQDLADLVRLKDISAKQVILTPSMFLSNQLAREIRAYSPVAWIITHATKKPYAPFSAATPNPWNPDASGLRWEALPFPIVYIANETSSNAFVAKAQWNQDHDAHDQSDAEVARLDPYVGPQDMNASKCYELKRCREMGGYSLWATVGKTDDRGKVFAVTQIDAVSMDMGKAVGANAGASGMIALMAAAATFNRSVEAKTYKRQIAFGFFDGESFGRMGSRRFVRDLAQWSCNNSTMGPHGYNICTDTFGKDGSTRAAPFWYWIPETFSKLNRTEYVLAVDHVGHRAKNQSGMFVHGTGGAAALASSNFGVNGMSLSKGIAPPFSSSSSSSSSLPPPSSSFPSSAAATFPPSAADSFLKGTHGMKITDNKIDVFPNGVQHTAVLTGFQTNLQEVNPMYQTAHDDVTELNVGDLVKISTTIARSLYAMATVESLNDKEAVKAAVASATHLTVDPHLIASLINCSVVSWDCSITEEYTSWMIDIARGKQNGSINLHPERRLQYLWKNQDGNYSAVPQVTIMRELLASVTASPEQIGASCVAATSFETCNINVTGKECIKNQCIEPNAWFHWAFQIDTESAWAATPTAINYVVVIPETSTQAVEVYRRANVVEEWWVLFVGVLMTCISVWIATQLIKNNDKIGIVTKGSM